MKGDIGVVVLLLLATNGFVSWFASQYVSNNKGGLKISNDCDVRSKMPIIAQAHARTQVITAVLFSNLLVGAFAFGDGILDISTNLSLDVSASFLIIIWGTLLSAFMVGPMMHQVFFKSDDE